MKSSTSNKTKILVFCCMRQNPEKFRGFNELYNKNEVAEIDLPCSGRVGVGEFMQGLAAGYSKVIVLSCGERNCIHKFGCVEAKKAMERARGVAHVAGIDPGRLIFVEADDPEMSEKIIDRQRTT